VKKMSDIALKMISAEITPKDKPTMIPNSIIKRDLKRGSEGTFEGIKR